MLNNRQREYLKFTLNEEKKTLRELEKLYEETLKSINEKITTLLARRDIENIDSIIYRLDYQKALKIQINAILDNLNANQYETIEKYLLDSYKNGFIGTMYDIHGQGIPLMIPMDQEQILNALTIDSKLSEGLYKRLGEDITTLKKKIRHEISRGIASAMSYADISRNISNISKIGINNAFRIARTEGHRIQNQSAFDAMNKAKEKGADVVKQWDATLDGRTRKTHRELDGKIVEVDEPFIFNGHKAMYPGGFSVASLDINCRCAVLTRAKWALDETENTKLDNVTGELLTIESKNYADFKNKYNDNLFSTHIETVKTLDGIIVDKIAKHTSARQKQREIPLEDIIDALTNPISIGKIKVDKLGRPSKQYIGLKATATINPDNHKVTTTWVTGKEKIKRILRKEPQK